MFLKPQHKHSQAEKNTNVKIMYQRDQTQRVLPFELLYEDGIAQIDEHTYSMTMLYEDVNYQAARDDEQDSIGNAWEELLDSFDSDTHIQLSILSRRIDPETFAREIALKDVEGDEHGNIFRREHNALVKSKLTSSNKSMKRTRALTLTCTAGTHDKARAKLLTSAARVKKFFSEHNSEITILDGQDRINFICAYTRPRDMENKTLFRDLDKSFGITIKDIICPRQLTHLPNGDIKIEDKYIRSYVVTDFGRATSDKTFYKLSKLAYDIAVTLHIDPWEQAEAVNFAENHYFDVTSENNTYKISNSRPERGYFVDDDNLPKRMQDAEKEASAIRGELVHENQHFFDTALIVTIFASTADELELASGDVCDIFREQRMPGITAWDALQENLYSSALPCGVLKDVPYTRNMTSHPLAGMIPFISIEIMDSNGIYLGVNADTHNIIQYDRTREEDANALITGQPGRGKSILTKLMILQLHHKFPDDDIICIDPEAEYGNVTKFCGGSIINLSATSKTHINPLDISVSYAAKSEGELVSPLSDKVDFLQTLINLMTGGVTDEEKNVIDYISQVIYEKWLETEDDKDIPTLKDFYRALKDIDPTNKPYADHLRTLLTRFVSGTFDMFAHHTNIDITSRVTDFVLKDLGRQLKPIAMLVLLNSVWVKVTRNRQAGRRTWLFTDEYQLLLDDLDVVETYDNFTSRGRKWGLYTTTITQNITRLLANEKTRYMVQNAPFRVFTRLSAKEADAVGAELQLPPATISLLKSMPIGEGLYVIAQKNLHYENLIPARLCPETYKIITTKFADVRKKSDEKHVQKEKEKALAKSAPSPQAVTKSQSIAQKPKKQNSKPKRTAFVKPSIDEIAAYVKDKKFHIDAEAFYAYYDSVGWRVGKNPMKSWKAACRTWDIRARKTAQAQQKGGVTDEK